MAEAIRYVLARWNGFTLLLDDGRSEIDNKCIERNMRPIAVTCSLCTLLLSVCKHWKLIFTIGVTRASFSLGQRCRNSLVAQIVGTYLVRRARYDLFGGKDALLNKPADNVIGHAKQFCSFTHRPPFAFLFGGAIGVNPVHPAQRADTVRSPGFPLTRAHSHPVQRSGNTFVGPSARHAAHDSKRLLRSTTTVFTGFRLADPQLRVLTALPVDCQDDLSGCFVNIGDDVDDKCAQELLARAHSHARSIPRGGEIVGKSRIIGRRGSQSRRSLQSCVEVSIRPDSRCRNCRVISGHLLVWWASLRNDFSRAIEVASMKVCMGVFPKQ